jgi:hypothetical protein
MRGRYGTGRPVDDLARLIEAVNYPGLDFTHLYPHPAPKPR